MSVLTAVKRVEPPPLTRVNAKDGPIVPVDLIVKVKVPVMVGLSCALPAGGGGVLGCVNGSTARADRPGGGGGSGTKVKVDVA